MKTYLLRGPKAVQPQSPARRRVKSLDNVLVQILASSLRPHGFGEAHRGDEQADDGCQYAYPCEFLRAHNTTMLRPPPTGKVECNAHSRSPAKGKRTRRAAVGCFRTVLG